MANPHHHIIERARIDVSSPTGNHALQKGVANWWSATAVPAIEEVLEELLPGGVHLRLDRLDLDLGRFKRLDPDLPGDRDALTERLKQALREALKELLANARAETYLSNAPASEQRLSQESKVAASSSDGRRFSAWLHYLEYGHRPWWSTAFPPATEWAEFIAVSLTVSERRAAVAALVRRSRAAALRLAADGRHTAAFRALLDRNVRLKAAWATWLKAAPAYAELAARLPVSAPPATEWTTAGGVVCWWMLLTETKFRTKTAALRRVLTQALPGIVRWPDEQLRQVLDVLELPNQNRRKSLADDEQTIEGASSEDKLTRQEGDEAITTDDELNIVPGEKALPVSEPDFPDLPRDQQPTFSANTALSEGVQPEELLSPAEEAVSRAVAETTLAGEDAATVFGGTGDAGGDVPRTVAWSEAGPTTPPAPAAAPPNAAEAWYIDHAGVVLAHPFLAPLFTALGYWAEGAFVDATAQQRAVYLTHYLATGAEESYEEDLPLCKLLCGWPVSGPPARLTVPLTPTDRHEADEVLRSVIEHWQALGAATPEGLREGFFAREGRLREGENGWRVTVDRRAQDILLGRLAWGISLVQAPWHDSFIKVEW